METSYPSPANAENHHLRRWFIGALVASLILHGIAALVFHASKLERISLDAPVVERLAPRPMTMPQARIDPRAFDTEVEPAPSVEKKPPMPELLPDERPKVEALPEKVTLTPETQESIKPLMEEKPQPIGGALPKVPQPEINSEIARELDAIRDRVGAENAPKIAPSTDLSHATGEIGEAGVGAEQPGFSNLDELLSRAGPLAGEVAPVAMPGGALFEYDSTELREASLSMLSKLAELIKRNPAATFSIEGHSDSFGNPEYNQQLSEDRAEAVKAWLVDQLGIDPARIATHGYGSSKLIAPATGSREEQQINRRVEIVIRTPAQP